MTQPRVLVVGAGAIGAWVGLCLARLGADCTLLDAGTPGGGTTRASFAWINASTKDDADYIELNREGMRRWAREAEAHGGLAGYRTCGAYAWADRDPEADALARRVARLRETGYAAELVSADALRARLPGVDLGDLAGDAAFFAEEGIADPDAVAQDVVGQYRRLGGRLRVGSRVAEIMVHQERAVGVRTAVGEELRADVVALAAGLGASELCAAIGVDGGLAAADAQGVAGATLHASLPAGTALDTVLRSPGINLRPGRAGAVIAHADDLDPTAAGPDAERHAAALVERSSRRLGATVTAGELRRARRVLPRDGRAIVGWAAGVTGLYVALSHSGVTLGPLLGHLASREIALDTQEQILGGFRPTRLGSPRALAEAGGIGT